MTQADFSELLVGAAPSFFGALLTLSLGRRLARKSEDALRRARQITTACWCVVCAMDAIVLFRAIGLIDPAPIVFLLLLYVAPALLTASCTAALTIVFASRRRGWIGTPPTIEGFGRALTVCAFLGFGLGSVVPISEPVPSLSLQRSPQP